MRQSHSDWKRAPIQNTCYALYHGINPPRNKHPNIEKGCFHEPTATNMRPTAFLCFRRKLSGFISVNSTVDEICNSRIYTRTQWAVFRVSPLQPHKSTKTNQPPQKATANVANAWFGKQAEPCRITSLTKADQQDLEREVNSELKKHGIHQMPGQDVLYWRWFRVFKTMNKTKAGT